MDQSKPDALMLPARLKQGERIFHRVASIRNIAEPILGIDRGAGERAYIRPQPRKQLFITKSIHDTIFYPKWHDLEGSPRYRWVKQPDGSKWGYLVEGATPGGEVPDDTEVSEDG